MNQDKEITLHYIDKLHITLIEVGKSINRNLTLSIIGSFILLGICNGMVSIDEKVGILGANVKIEFWMLILLIALLLTIFYIRFHSLIHHEEKLRDSIVRLYKELSFFDESMNERELNFLEHPNIITTLTSENNLNHGKLTIFFNFTISFVCIVVPIIAILYAFYTLYGFFGFQLWLMVIFLVSMFFIITFTISSLRTYT